MVIQGQIKTANAGASTQADALKKIWVGGLPEGVSQEEINGAFAAAGKVTDVKTLRGNKACVTYSNAAQAKKAIDMFNGGDFNGSTLEVDKWTGGSGGGNDGKPKKGLGGKSSGKGNNPMEAMAAMLMAAMKGGGGKASGKGWGGKGNRRKRLDSSLKVWVGNLPEGITEKEMKDAFSAAGTVKEAVPFGAKRNHEGCVAFASAAEAQQAISMLNGGDFNGNTIEVDTWEKKEKK
jgi:RNA recognition motif-containing protein